MPLCAVTCHWHAVYKLPSVLIVPLCKCSTDQGTEAPEHQDHVEAGTNSVQVQYSAEGSLMAVEMDASTVVERVMAHVALSVIWNEDSFA